jgi:hypothetical protein
MAVRIFNQQAKAIGRLFTIDTNVSNPDATCARGDVDSAPTFREWFPGNVWRNVNLRVEAAVATSALGRNWTWPALEEQPSSAARLAAI